MAKDKKKVEWESEINILNNALKNRPFMQVGAILSL